MVAPSREQGPQCAAYGVLIISACLPTVKHNTKTEMQMCQSIVSKAKEGQSSATNAREVVDELAPGPSK